MKINVITGLFPTESSEYGGVFIYERLKCLHNAKIHFETWVVQNVYSSVIHCGYYLVKHQKLKNKVLLWDLNESQHVLENKTGLGQIIKNHFSFNAYVQRMEKILDDNIEFQEGSIIHAHWVYPHGYVATRLAKKHNVPCVITALGSDIHTCPRNNKKIKKYTLDALNNANKVIFVSNALLSSAKELGYSGNNAVVIPNGIDSTYFYPMTKEDAAKKTGWKQTKKYVVGFVGNLIPVKRADKFAEIFQRINAEINEIEFIIVGDGYLKNEIEENCRKNNILVTFAGKVPHNSVCAWMNLFDGMILPSRNEGWPTVVLEAFACGVPVIGSTNGGVAESIGGLCPSIPESEIFETEFAHAVCDVLSKKIEIHSTDLQKRALEHTWDACVQKEIEVYQSLC